jgi:hypothetical protein
MRLMAVGSKLCVVSFWECEQFGPIDRDYLHATPEVYQAVREY